MLSSNSSEQKHCLHTLGCSLAMSLLSAPQGIKLEQLSIAFILHILNALSSSIPSHSPKSLSLSVFSHCIHLNLTRGQGGEPISHIWYHSHLLTQINLSLERGSGRALKILYLLGTCHTSHDHRNLKTEWVHEVSHSTRSRFHIFKLHCNFNLHCIKKRIIEVPDQHCHLTFIIDGFITP